MLLHMSNLNMPVRRTRRCLLIVPLMILVTFCVKGPLLSLISRPTGLRAPSDFRYPPKRIEPLEAEDSSKEISKVTAQVPPNPIHAKHEYRSDGLLTVNPDASHPILELIERAEKEWADKLAKASRSLGEAVAEYERRYKRPPPRGFDDWWRYATEHNVQLLDEYDFIWRDLEPFWGIDPVDLLAIQARQEEQTDSFTLGNNATGDIEVVKRSFSNPETWEQRHLLRGAEEMMDLLKPVQKYLPPFRAIFSPHDNPNLLSDYHVKKAVLDAAAARKYVDIANLPPTKHLGFASACPPSTPGRPRETHVDQHNRPIPRTNKTFIYDHRQSMDPCLHPQIFYNHAQFVAHDVGPAPQPHIAAQFSYCSTMLHHDIQPPTFIAWTDDIYPRENDPEWENKTDERLLWRGTNTGINYDKSTRWMYSQRIHLVRMANELEGKTNILMPESPETEIRDGKRVGAGIDMPHAMINPAMMDIAFTGKPIACEHEPGYCDYLETLFEWRRPQFPNGKEAGNHKYIIDVDGNGWSSRFKRLITSNSLIFKSTTYPEWWLDRVQPWVHYVPVQVDLSDVYDALVFFRGGMYGEGNHDDLARKIALAGRDWSKTYWRKEDMTAYFFRLLLEYSRIMSLDRDAMAYHGRHHDVTGPTTI